MRAEHTQRTSLESIRSLQIPLRDGKVVPLRQIASFEYSQEYPIVWRRDRVPTLTVQADVVPGLLPATAVKAVQPSIDQLAASLPSGYRIVAGGSVEESAKAQASVQAVLPVMMVLVLTILMFQLQSFQRVLLVLSVAPLGLIGVVAALLLAQAPLGFVAILGVLALVGMIARNSVILIDEVGRQIEAGQHVWDAVVTAAIHRTRPILLTPSAATLGMIPIAPTVFWGPMAFAIIGGLDRCDRADADFPARLVCGLVPGFGTCPARICAVRTSFPNLSAVRTSFAYAMSALILSGIIFVLTLGGIFLGTLLRRTLPEHHLNEHARDVVRLGVGLIATIAALVLGLLIAAAKGSFDTQTSQVRQITANLILLDNILAQYGPEARSIREQIRSTVDPFADRLWREKESGTGRAHLRRTARRNRSIWKFRSCHRTTMFQRSLKTRAVQISNDLAQVRFLLFVESENLIPTPFLAVLAFWLMIIFASFSLFSPLNATVLTCLLLFALSAACAIFLILELSRPFTGLMSISSAPMRNALGTI